MTPKRITIHCSATPNGKRYDISKIRNYHQSLGWKDVGYHIVIQPDGEMQRGRYLNVTGAHVSGANKDNVGVCLIGTDQFTTRQFESMAYFLDGMRLTYDIPFKEIYGHYEYPSAREQGKSCPNIKARDLIAWLYTGDSRIVNKYLVKEDRDE